MITSHLEYIKTHLTKNIIYYLSFCVVVISLIISIQFPTYFGHGDTRHFEVVVDNDNPFSFFNPDNLVFEHYRPMVHFVQWIQFRLFGVNPFPYYIFNLLMYGFSFVIFFKLVALVYSRRIAVFSLLSYFTVFFWIAYVPFSISFITFILEIFFLNLSLYFLISAIRGRCSFVWGILLYLCASMTKESPLIIVPATVSFYLFTEWKDLMPKRRKEAVIVLGVIWTLGVVGFVISPFTFSPSEGLTEKITFIYKRWNFYADHLLSNFGVLIWFSTFFLAFRYLFNLKGGKIVITFYIPLVLALVISVILSPFHGIALLALFITFIPLILKRVKESFAIVWFALSLAGFMTIEFMSRTYLTDASFGIAIIVGVAFGDIISNLNVELRRLPSRFSKSILFVLFVIAYFWVYGFTSEVKDKLDVLYVVSATRENFRDVMTFISNNLDDPRTQLIVIDYEEMGLSSDYQYWLYLTDLERAHLQKTMKGVFVERWLRYIVGKENIHVHNLGWFLKNPDVKGCFLFAMNKYEIRFVEGLKLKKNAVYKVERGRESAALYYIHK